MRPLGSTSVADIVKIQIIYPGQAIENKTIQLQLHHQRPGHPVSHGDSRYSQHRTVARRSAVTMNVLLSPQLPVFPHQHENLHLSQRNLSSIHNMSSRKRKADDDGDENMSPMSSPAVSSRPLIRPSKKFRSNDLIGRPLSLSRLLETLDTNQLRTVLERICERHLDIGQEVVSGAPRPTVDSAMNVLYGYQERLNAAAPYGESSAEYTYDRVRSHIVALIDALSDFTPQFLPPIETQPTKSLEFLDGATRFIHGLPDWQPQTYRHHKDNAYEDISKAWALVVNEAAKRGGGFNLHSDGWDQKLARHNEQSGGRLAPAITAMSNSVGWMGSNENGSSSEQGSILSQLVSGAYGSPVRVGPW